MITTLGLKRNFYSEELVDSEVVLKDLILCLFSQGEDFSLPPMPII
jgi:hypothetical protein